MQRSASKLGCVWGSRQLAGPQRSRLVPGGDALPALFRMTRRRMHSTPAVRHSHDGKCDHKSTTSGAIPWTFTPHDGGDGAPPARAPPAREQQTTNTKTSTSTPEAAAQGQGHQVERQGPAPVKQGGVSSLDYCITQSKLRNTSWKLDYEHYLCGMYLPKEARAPYSVLRAFNIETALIKDIAKQVPIALMRIQFWRDLLDKSYKGNPPEHPIALQIAAMVPRYKWTRTWFTRILNKRAEDIEGRPIPTLAALENFTEDTSSSLLYLTLESLRIRNMDADHAASHIGKAVGISVLLRGTPFHLQHRQTYLPMDLLAKHGVAEESLYRGELEHAQNLPEVVYEVASAAHAHLKHARELQPTVPKEAYPALYSSFIAENYLNKLEKAKFNIFDPSLRPTPQGSLGLQAKLMYNHYVGRKY